MPEQPAGAPLVRLRRARPALRLCAALTFDGKLTSPAESGAWAVCWSRLCARSDAVLVDDGASSPTTTHQPTGPPLRRIVDSEMSDIRGLIRQLRAVERLPRLLCGGGPALFQALLTADLADELHLVIRPCVSGIRREPTLTGLPGDFFPASIPWRLRRLESADDECILEYRRQRKT